MMNVPDGWKLVPIDPTEQMFEAAEAEFKSPPNGMGVIWDALLAAAPAAPVAATAPSEWASAAEWLRNNYQDYANVASLCAAMISASPRKGK